MNMDMYMDSNPSSLAPQASAGLAAMGMNRNMDMSMNTNMVMDMDMSTAMSMDKIMDMYR